MPPRAVGIHTACCHAVRATLILSIRIMTSPPHIAISIAVYMQLTHAAHVPRGSAGSERIECFSVSTATCSTILQFFKTFCLLVSAAQLSCPHRLTAVEKHVFLSTSYVIWFVSATDQSLGGIFTSANFGSSSSTFSPSI